MAISRDKKEQLVQDYVEQLNSSEAIIFTDYTGLSVAELQNLRSRIREAEGSFTVVKNTLVRRALEEVGLPLEDQMLTGPIGLGFCNQNVTGVAKAISDFSKDYDQLAIKGGLMGTKVIDEAAIKELASLPSIEVLQAQLLGLINAPASRLVGVVAGGVRQLVNVFNAYSETGSEAEASTEA
jgi:large subunit ribosomal protein L10